MRTLCLYFAVILTMAATSALSARAGQASAGTQDATEAPLRTISSTGKATVEAEPDKARVQIGVVTEAKTAKAAAERNASNLSDVLADLRKILGFESEIETSQYTLRPKYDYSNGHEPRIDGYIATNVVTVTTKDLELVGRIIDVGTGSGANTIQSVQFELEDEQPVREQALKLAVLRARHNAEALAAALNLKVLRVISVSYGGAAAVQPVRRMARAESAAVQTPIEPGRVQVSAAITLTVEIGSK